MGMAVFKYNFYFPKQVAGQIWPVGHRLPTSVIWWCFVSDIYIYFQEGTFPFLECLCQVLKLALYWPHKMSSVVFPLLFSDSLCKIDIISYLNDGIYQGNYLGLSFFLMERPFFFFLNTNSIIFMNIGVFRFYIWVCFGKLCFFKEFVHFFCYWTY